jgi:hypothetical protein
VPFGAGGSIDIAARTLAQIVQPVLRTPVTVNNQPGASGATGTRLVLGAGKDGQTWLFHRVDLLEGYAGSGAVDTRLSDWRFYQIMTKGSQRYGIFIHKNAPAPVLRTLDMIWDRVVANSSQLRTVARSAQAEFSPRHGEAALGRESSVAPVATAPTSKPAPPPIASATPAPTPAPAVAPPSITAPIPSISGPRVALVLGNGGYRHATTLANPTNDAADVAAALRKLGFDVVEGRDLDKRGMEDKLREFGRKLNNASLALFFYAGHGMQVAGKNYLIPVDAKLEQPGDLHLDTIDVGFVLAQMEADRRVNLVFLDACRDNPLARSFARRLGTRSSSVGQGLASIKSGGGTMIAYATDPDAVALDGDGRNSPFTTALLRHLPTPGLEIGLLMRRVRSEVYQATRGKQTPWDHSSLFGEVVLAR